MTNNLRRSARFLRRIYRAHQRGHAFLAARSASGWRETALLVDDFTAVVDFLQRHDPQRCDLYFCPNAFSRPTRLGTYALKTPYAWCDIDDAEPQKFKPAPNITWETSPGRFQGLWIFDEVLARLRAQSISKFLAYQFGGDRNGWSVTKFLRIPWTFNHKGAYRKPQVKIVSANWSPQATPMVDGQWRACSSIKKLTVDPSRHDPDAVFERYRRRLSVNVCLLIGHARVMAPDRSKRIFQIVAGLHQAGATPDEIAAVLWRTAYFISKHGQRRDHLDVEISRIVSKLGER